MVDDGYGRLTVRMIKGAGSVGGLTLLCVLCACSPLSVQIDSPPVLVQGVPFFPQEEFQCGPASLAGVMNYWGVAVRPEEVSREIFSGTARGTLTIDMMLFAERKGLPALQYRGGWDDLRRKLAAGHPVVVLVDRGLSLYQANHFMVVVGFDDRSVIVNSGVKEREPMETKAFLRQWERAGFWTLWIHREGS